MSDPIPFGFTVPPALLDRLADEVAARVVERIGVAGRSAPWLDVEGAAAYLVCPTSRIYDLVAAKRIRCARDGRRLLFRPEWLDAALSS